MVRDCFFFFEIKELNNFTAAADTEVMETKFVCLFLFYSNIKKVKAHKSQGLKRQELVPVSLA